MFMSTGLFMTRENFLVCSLSVKVSARIESQIEGHLVEDHIIPPKRPSMRAGKPPVLENMRGTLTSSDDKSAH